MFAGMAGNGFGPGALSRKWSQIGPVTRLFQGNGASQAVANNSEATVSWNAIQRDDVGAACWLAANIPVPFISMPPMFNRCRHTMHTFWTSHNVSGGQAFDIYLYQAPAAGASPAWSRILETSIQPFNESGHTTSSDWITAPPGTIFAVNVYNQTGATQTLSQPANAWNVPWWQVEWSLAR